jgi:hypothetical protein
LKEWPESVVHQRLEGGWCVVHHHLEGGRRVCQAEWHDKELEEPLVGVECHFLHIGAMHPHLMVAGP